MAGLLLLIIFNAGWGNIQEVIAQQRESNFRTMHVIFRLPKRMILYTNDVQIFFDLIEVLLTQAPRSKGIAMSFHLIMNKNDLLIR